MSSVAKICVNDRRLWRAYRRGDSEESGRAHLKSICKASPLEEAEHQLDRFEERWAETSPMISKSW